MGKAAKQRLDAKKRLLFAPGVDGRSAEERAQARAMLDALQKKLEDDALHEDGFFFVDGAVVAARRPRTSSGMKVRSFDDHIRSVKALSLVELPATAANDNSRNAAATASVVVVTFGLDRVMISDFCSTATLATIDVTHCDARFICGAAVAAVWPPIGSLLATASGSIARPHVLIAYATRTAPVAHLFDPQTNTIEHSANSKTDTATTSVTFTATHQQQITAIAIRSGAQLLATTSWDSTCMLYRVEALASTLTPTLTLLQILPVDVLGASSLCFTLDNQQLVTTGDCTIHVWDVASAPTASQALDDERTAWDAALPCALSVATSFELLAFDAPLAALVPHHAWHMDMLAAATSNDERAVTLQVPHNEVKQPRHCPIETVVNKSTASLQTTDTNSDDSSSGNLLESSPSSTRKLEPSSPLQCAPNEWLSRDDAVALTQLYQDLDSFDFDALLDPTRASLTLNPVSNHSSSDSDVTAPCNSPNVRSNALSATPSTPLAWRPLRRPVACTMHVATFDDRDACGRFVAHTSRITCCAVSVAHNIVVTVALDRMLKFWSLATSQVLETVVDAHAAPIACCAATTAPSNESQIQNLLIATGARDNTVKLWRRDCSAGNSTTACVSTLFGHYDALTACAFDATGTFLVTTSDDTSVNVWRIVPAPPDVPAPLSVGAIDKSSITLAWLPPLANGSPLLHYTLRYTVVRSSSSLSLENKELVGAAVGERRVERDEDSRSYNTLVVPAKYTSKCVDGLQPGTAYAFTLAAVNAIGASAFSDSTPPITTLAFVPSRIEPPLQASDCVGNNAATQIQLRWTVPADNGARIERFVLRCLPENSVFVPVHEVSVAVEALGAQNDKVVTSVDKRQQQRPRLSAATASATSTQRKAAAATTKPKAKATKRQAKAMHELSPTDTVAYHSHVVDGLWPGEIYQFVVAAVNRCGTAAFSRVSDYHRMPSTAPDPPGAPLIVAIQKRKATIEWTPPKRNGSDIVQYTLEWTQRSDSRNDIDKETASVRQDDDIYTVVLLARSITGTRYTLDGLAPGEPLRVWLAASNVIANVVCTSQRSPPSVAARTLSDVPDTPQQPELQALAAKDGGSHTLLLRFALPKCNGEPIERVDVLLCSESVQHGVTARQLVRTIALQPDVFSVESPTMRQCSVVVSNLRGKTLYSVQLSAANALGASALSECSSLVATQPATVPARLLAAPAVVGDVEPTRVRIVWTVPTHDGGAPLTAFYVQYSTQPTATVLGGGHEEKIGIDDSHTRRYKALFEHEVTVPYASSSSVSCELLATFLKPKSTYRFRVASANAIGRSAFSKKSAAIHTPSLVDFTIAQYFANRPAIEHAKARYIQRRYRAWKCRVAQHQIDRSALRLALQGLHML